MPAGSVLQVVSNTFIAPASSTSATNTTYATTPAAIIDGYRTTITPKSSTSIIIITMGIALAAERSGPSRAQASIGYFVSDNTSVSASDFTEVSSTGSSLMQHRQSISGGDWNQVDDRYVSLTTQMKFAHNHTVNAGETINYTALTLTNYSNASASYEIGLNSVIDFDITLMEIAQ
jgi:hypothetical protein